MDMSILICPALISGVNTGMNAALIKLKEEFSRLVASLDVENHYKSFYAVPTHDGSPHIELVDGRFHYVVTERGTEFERIEDLSADDVLYLLCEGVTHHMACAYELNNRIEGIDGRSVRFPHHERLMHELNPDWGKRTKEKHEAILAQYPFSHGPSVPL